MAVEGGTRVVKYLLFVFNLLFLLAGLALIVVGAVVAAKMSPYSNIAGVHFNGVGVFIIIIGCITLIISFFGCLGAYKENYCLVVTFIIMLVLILLLLIAALIAGFVMRDKVTKLVTESLHSAIEGYDKDDKEDVDTKFWDGLQREFDCCGASNYTDWRNNSKLNETSSVPITCCVTETSTCGDGKAVTGGPGIYTAGCGSQLSNLIYGNMVAAGGVAAAIAILIFIGIIFASCLAHGIRKGYNVV